jgi:hypothetical protein
MIRSRVFFQIEHALTLCIFIVKSGDPFKDTSGPALNIVMKLMAVLSLVFADTFFAINGGQGIFKL